MTNATQGKLGGCPGSGQQGKQRPSTGRASLPLGYRRPALDQPLPLKKGAVVTRHLSRLCTLPVERVSPSHRFLERVKS